MKRVARYLSFVGLGLTVVPSMFTFAGLLTPDANKTFMLIGTILWFGAAMFWMKSNRQG